MRLTTTSWKRGLAGALLVAVARVGGQSAPAPLDRAMYERVGAFLRRGDANGDRQLGPEELTAVGGAVAGQHGERGVRILRQYVTEADANRDGTLTLLEWEALGQRISADGVVQETVMVPMADGAKLATEVWRPAATGVFPVILQRTPYGRVRKDEVPPAVRQGYAVVSQDMRGRFDSEGDNLPFIGCGWQGHQDGLDTLRWVPQQPWCSGKVGTQGGSAGGITQNLLAGAAAEGLACQYIHVAAASLYHHAAYVGGALRQCQVENWLKGNEFAPEALELYKGHPRYDGFWEAFDSVRRHDRMTVPAVHVGGWFDTFSLGTVTAFTGRQDHGGPGAKGTQKLVMGPWAHGGFHGDGKVGDLAFRDARAPAEYGAGRWFDHYLKGVDNGADRLPAVTYYVMGDVEAAGAPGNEWRRSETWPPARTETRLFLAADRRLVATEPQATGPAATVAYSFDPANPCPTRGGGNLSIPAGPMDQQPIEGRPDVLCFSTEPLTDPIEITGQIGATVFLASDAVDTDLSVRFCDVYPDGRSFLMAEGMLRARCREGLEKEAPLVPGTVYPLTVELWPTSVVVNTGHRLRVTVTSSNYPRFDVNPGTGKPAVAGEPMQVQRNTIHCSAEHPSHVVLPVPVAPRRAGP